MSYRKWSKTEIQFIANNYRVMCDENIAAKLSQITGSTITTGMVRRQRRKYGLDKKRGRPKSNTIAEMPESITQTVEEQK